MSYALTADRHPQIPAADEDSVSGRGLFERVETLALLAPLFSAQATVLLAEGEPSRAEFPALARIVSALAEALRRDLGDERDLADELRAATVRPARPWLEYLDVALDRGHAEWRSEILWLTGSPG